MKKALSLFLALVMVLGLAVSVCADAASESINLAMQTVMGNCDPHQNNTINGNNLLWNVYEGMFFIDDVGDLIPRVADSYEVSEDGLTYTVHLNPAVKFHNGDPVTAEDVAYSLTRVADYSAWVEKVSHIASMEVVDANTLKIVADSTMAIFMNSLSQIMILSKADCEKYGQDAGLDIDHVIAGTGPYTFTEFKPDSSIKLTAFADYYRGPAAIKNVNYKVMTDASTILAALETGEIDFASTTTGNIEVIEGNDNLALIMNPSTHNSYLKFNWFDNEILADKRVRQAVCYAINKEEVMFGCYDGYGDIAENFAREGLVFGATTDGVTVYDYNPEKAKELLAEAGYPDGVDLGTIWACGTLYFAQGAQIMQQELADVGIKVECQLLEQKAVENAIFRDEDKWDLAFHGGAMTVDSDNFYDWMFNPAAGTYVGRGAGDARYDINPRLVELGEQAKTTVDREARAELYKEFWQIAQDEAYVVSIFHRYNPYAANKDLNVNLYTSSYYLYDFSWK